MTFKIKTLVSVYILQNEYQPNVNVQRKHGGL